MGGGMAPRKPSVCPTGTHIHLHGSPTRLPYACPEHGCYETSQTQTRRQSSGRSVAAVGFKGGLESLCRDAVSGRVGVRQGWTWGS